jgi:hypothetical protein
MIFRLCLNEMVLQSGENELSLRQRPPDGPGRILVNRRAAANLVNAGGPIRTGHLHHDPPLHPVPRFPDQADRSTPRFWTVSLSDKQRQARTKANDAVSGGIVPKLSVLWTRSPGTFGAPIFRPRNASRDCRYPQVADHPSGDTGHSRNVRP